MEPDESRTTPPSDDTPGDPEDESTFASVQRRLEGKPMLIYGTLVGGALALLFLLVVVWLSTRNSGPEVQLCLDTTVAEAESAILEGNVRRADVLLDAELPVEGLTAIQLQLQDDECRKLPEGADHRAELLQVLGLIELYNQEGDGNVRVEYQREAIPPNLLMTSTPIPTNTPPTAEASPTVATPIPVAPTSTATVTPKPSPSHTPQPTATKRPTVAPTKRPTLAPSATP